MPNKIDCVVSALAANPDAGWCFHSLQLIRDSGTGNLLATTATDQAIEKSQVTVLDFRDQIRRGSLTFVAPPTSGLCFRREVLQEILPMPEAIKITSDNYVKLASVALRKGLCLSTELSLQRIHGNNAYTLRSDNQYKRARARMLLLTGYHLRASFPCLRRLSNRMIARGIAASWRVGGIEHDLRPQIRSIMSSNSALENIDIAVRTMGHRMLDTTVG